MEIWRIKNEEKREKTIITCWNKTADSMKVINYRCFRCKTVLCFIIDIFISSFKSKPMSKLSSISSQHKKLDGKKQKDKVSEKYW